MAEELHIPQTDSREEKYIALLPQIAALLECENDLVANLANVTAVLRQAFGFFWVGFYRREGEELVLAPFQGPLACSRISLSEGVCGASASEKKSILVPNVEEFPGHIACSSESKSEVVIPLVVDGETKLVLDVDSDQLDDFSRLDVNYLEQVVELIGRRHYA